MSELAPLPLTDVRILTASSFGAGPWATMQLAELGAEVIKIEHPAGGDAARSVPPLTDGVENDSVYFQSMNRNKRSITLNLRSPGGQEILHGLVRVSHAVYNNLRGDQPRKLGLDYQALGAVNPQIVCTSCSAFGTQSSHAAEPGYDYLIQAMTGYMALTGEPDAPPTRCAVSVIDFASGLISIVGLVAAVHRARATGQGGDVETSLYAGALSMLNYLAAWNLNLGFVPDKLSNAAHQTAVPAQNFPTRDSCILIMCMKDSFFPPLCDALGLPDVPADPRFCDMQSRLRHRDELITLLSDALRTRTTDEWIERLRGRVPCAPVYELEQALAHPALEELGLLWEVEHPKLGALREIGSPLRLSDTEPSPRSPAPALGADTDAVLSEFLGLSAREIAQLRERGDV